MDYSSEHMIDLIIIILIPILLAELNSVRREGCKCRLTATLDAILILYSPYMAEHRSV